jgi:hypothetical protein
MNSEELKPHFWPGMMVIIFSTLGWLGMPERPVIYADAIPGVKIVEALFATPGGLVAAMLAMLFSLQGVHGIEDFDWIVLPANLIIYFGLFTNFAGAAEVIRSQRNLNFLDLALRNYPQYFRCGLRF